MYTDRMTLFRPITVRREGLARIYRHKVVGLLHLPEFEQYQGLVWRCITEWA